jgi:O-antigen/teichoic acid export membrane protein
MTNLDLLQWLGCFLSITGATLVMFNHARARFYGMVCYFFTNLVMLAWAYPTHNWGILTTQFVFFLISCYSIKTHWKDR